MTDTSIAFPPPLSARSSRSTATSASISEALRRRFDTLTSAVFPNYRNLPSNAAEDAIFAFQQGLSDRRRGERSKSQSKTNPASERPKTIEELVATEEIVSSFWLQVLLYFNVYFSGFFVVLTLVEMVYKATLPASPALTTPILMFVAWFAFEFGRLWLGYRGNLSEKVPHLAAFFFLSVFPQCVLVIYFVALQKPLYTLDRIIGIIYAVFLLLELIVGYYAVGVVINAQTRRFAARYTSLQHRAEVEAGSGDHSLRHVELAELSRDFDEKGPRN